MGKQSEARKRWPKPGKSAPVKRGHQYSACHICGCTYERGCPVGCSWVHKDGELPLCSVCAGFALDLKDYIESAARVSRASLGRALILVIGEGALIEQIGLVITHDLHQRIVALGDEIRQARRKKKAAHG